MEKILIRLPGINCGNCGFARCDEFANALINKTKITSDCPVLLRENYYEAKILIENILKQLSNLSSKKKKIIGLIDNYEADIILEPLSNENSCREVLLPMSNFQIKINDVIKYRPLGCPIIHFAEIIKIQHSLITVHIIGSCHRMNEDFQYKDIGTCMVIAFEGRYHGKNIKIGDTVRFLPNHCMMQKIHSGVVVNLEGNKVIIEGIDLKVWKPAQKSEQKYIEEANI